MNDEKTILDIGRRYLESEARYPADQLKSEKLALLLNQIRNNLDECLDLVKDGKGHLDNEGLTYHHLDLCRKYIAACLFIRGAKNTIPPIGPTVEELLASDNDA